MIIRKPAAAGTLESCDAQVSIEPSDSGIELEIDSVVISQYGRRIREVVMETLERLEVTHGKIRVVDKGALDCTLRARVEAAVYRASGQTEPVLWGGAVR